MRFTKPDILEVFRRQDTSYRLAILATHWLRGGPQYKPSAPDEANSLQMKIRDQWISFSDLGAMLATDGSTIIVTSEFILNQLHALVRAPFELLADYCQDYDAAAGNGSLVQSMRSSSWHAFARHLRNAISHNFRFEFRPAEKKRLPITWNGITLTEALDGQPVTYEFLSHKSGYELFLEMRSFAESLPVPVDQPV